MTLSSELDFEDEGDADGGKAGEDGDEDGEYFQLFYLDMCMRRVLGFLSESDPGQRSGRRKTVCPPVAAHLAATKNRTRRRK